MKKYLPQLPVQDFALAVAMFFALGIVIIATASKVPAAKTGVLAADLNVSAMVPICELYLTAYPEGRIPPTNNWATTLQVQILDVTNATVLNITDNTNNLGQLYYDLCGNAVVVGQGPHDFYLLGFSHLRKKFNDVTSLSSYVSTVQFTQPGDALLAGETSIVFDNFINGLDLSTQVINLFSGDVKNDLNLDGQVNSLDLSMTVNNLYKQGD